MPTLLVDTNALRRPALEEYLTASRDNHIVLSDLVLIEMRKRNAISTSRQSLAIACRYPMQVYVLKRTHEILDVQVSQVDEVGALLDYPASHDLSLIAQDLYRVPVPLTLTESMAELEAEASLVIVELTSQMASLEDSLVRATKEFNAEQLRQLRTGIGITVETGEIFFRLLKGVVAQFFVTNGLAVGRKGMMIGEAMRMFGFRYALCMMIYYVRWVQHGRQVGRRQELRVNDVIDMQLAAMSTYFNGVLSGDSLVKDTSSTVRSILRMWGAFVGDDWSPILISGRRA